MLGGAEGRGLPVPNYIPTRGYWKVDGSGDEGVEEEVEGGDAAVADDDEVGSGVGRRLAGAARYPADAASIVQLLRFGCGRVLEVGMGRGSRLRFDRFRPGRGERPFLGRRRRSRRCRSRRWLLGGARDQPDRIPR